MIVSFSQLVLKKDFTKDILPIHVKYESDHLLLLHVKVKGLKDNLPTYIKSEATILLLLQLKFKKMKTYLPSKCLSMKATMFLCYD